MKPENFERRSLWGLTSSAGSMENGDPPPLRRPGWESRPALSLRAPRPKLSPRPHEFKSGARPGQWRPTGSEARPCCPLPGIGTVWTGSERGIRGLWSVDANRLRRALAEDRGPVGAADRSRKRSQRLRRGAARAVCACAELGRAAVGVGAAGIVRCVQLCSRFCSGFANRLKGGDRLALTSYSYPRKFPHTCLQKVWILGGFTRAFVKK